MYIARKGSIKGSRLYKKFSTLILFALEEYRWDYNETRPFNSLEVSLQELVEVNTRGMFSKRFFDACFVNLSPLGTIA